LDLWFLRKRKAEREGLARARKPELQDDSRVVSEFGSDEKQRAEIMSGLSWRVSSPISEEAGEVHELGAGGNGL